jgi:hypothetical protein
MSQKTCQRKVFRIQYPESDRPRLSTASASYEIIDCSESGLRYRLGGAPAPAVSKTVQGTVHFGCGDSAELSGFVLRVQDDLVAVRLAKSIPAGIMLREQRWLRDRAREQALAAAK